MSKGITVNTRLGNGGKWITVAHYATGPLNLMKAIKALDEEQKSNRGTGGYHSNLEIDGNVIGQEHFEDLNIETAKKIIADPAAYFPFESFVETTPKRPPAERGQGRKSLQGAGKSPVVQLRVTPELKDKIKQKGPEWVRCVLKKSD